MRDPQPLAGRKGVILGIANESSVAWGCARAYRELGAELAITYLNDKAERYVRPLAEQVGAPIIMPLDVRAPGQMEAVFDAIRATWGRLDFALHSIAFAPKEDLQGRVLDCSAEGFQIAMDVSCHSFIRLARLAAPLMVDGGNLITMTYLGSIERLRLDDHGAHRPDLRGRRGRFLAGGDEQAQHEAERRAPDGHGAKG